MRELSRRNNLQFGPDNRGGRRRGSRNRLSSRFLEALAADFEEGGAAAIKLCRLEEPTKYVAIVASLMPKEVAIEHTQLGDLTDEEIGALIDQVREMRAKLIEHKPDEAAKWPTMSTPTSSQLSKPLLRQS
jgi:hypothetical protein